MVICLERGADLHMAQLMPLPLTVSCFSKIQIGYTFLVPADPGSPGKRAVKRVCVYMNFTDHEHAQQFRLQKFLYWRCVAPCRRISDRTQLQLLKRCSQPQRIVTNKVSPRGWRDDMLPRRRQFDGGISFRRKSGHRGSKNRGGSTSVRGRVRSPHFSGGRRWLICRQ